MSFAAELKDFMSGFNAGLSMSKKVGGAIQEYRDKKELEDAKRQAEDAVDGRDPDDVVMPVRRASDDAPEAIATRTGNDRQSRYSTSAYGGDPYTGNDGDVAAYLDDEDKELAPILNMAFKDGKNWGALTYKRDKTPGGTADLENMTIAQVYDLQRGMKAKGHASSAVGGFQTIHGTLKRAVDGLGLDPATTKFDRRTQAKIAAHLARTDGNYNDFKAGKISAAQLAKELSEVWAVLPKDASGRGSYDGFNGNRAGVSYSAMSDAIGAGRSSRQAIAAIDEEDDDADF